MNIKVTFKIFWAIQKQNIEKSKYNKTKIRKRL